MKIWKGLFIVGLVMIGIGVISIPTTLPILFLGILVFLVGLAIGFERFIRRAKYE